MSIKLGNTTLDELERKRIAFLSNLDDLSLDIYTDALVENFPNIVAKLRADAKRIAELEELHRMQLASIAAISLCNTRTSAEKHRNILPEYRTPEFELVCDAVDREMGHREKVAELEADKEKLTALVDELRHQIAGLRADKARMDYLQSACLAADFDYGERHESVLVFRWPSSRVSANLRATIDAATQEQGK